MIGNESLSITTSQLIQLAIPPVFMIAGIGSMLASMVNRLSRIIDRARHLENRLREVLADTEHSRDEIEHTVTNINAELSALARRSFYANWAIGLGTAAAMLLCALIGVVFVSGYFGYQSALAIVTLFVSAVSLLLVGLICFLREILVAAASIKIAPYRLPPEQFMP